MIEPSAAPSAARAQAESSKKRNATAKPASKSKRQSTVATSLLVPRNSITSLSISRLMTGTLLCFRNKLRRREQNCNQME